MSISVEYFFLSKAIAYRYRKYIETVFSAWFLSKTTELSHIAKTDSADMTFRKFELASTGDDCSRELRHRWNIVPANTWHFPEASSLGDWCTVTFHSASSAEIIDEDWIEEL
jgi:hypothetical protein